MLKEVFKQIVCNFVLFWSTFVQYILVVSSYHMSNAFIRKTKSTNGQQCINVLECVNVQLIL